MILIGQALLLLGLTLPVAGCSSMKDCQIDTRPMVCQNGICTVDEITLPPGPIYLSQRGVNPGHTFTISTEFNTCTFRTTPGGFLECMPDSGFVPVPVPGSYQIGQPETRSWSCTQALWATIRDAIDVLAGAKAQRDIAPTLKDAQEACQ